jgi:hypothetical protein
MTIFILVQLFSAFVIPQTISLGFYPLSKFVFHSMLLISVKGFLFTKHDWQCDNFREKMSKRNHDCHDGPPGQELSDRIARTRQPGQGSNDRTARTGRPGQDCQERTIRTGSPGQVRPVKTSYQYCFYLPPILNIQKANFVNIPLKKQVFKTYEIPPVILKKRYIET